MWNEFKKFALKGNVMDLAVGVVIGGAFGKIVSSLVNDIIMPLIGILLGGVDFTGLSYPVGDATLKYGAFIQTIVDFFIIAFSIFLFIKLFNKLSFKKEEEKKEEVPAALSKEEALLTEIRDLLKQQNTSRDNA
ncbi:large conductance mechanosensitive channel protein MscL [Bacillus rhizoplanae]|uniref:large conductance mechanosensitive channel protein MscL n=1 Tax=Bacillus rhizoplanae TaxID=2880966 RepID=UPI003D1EC0CA